MIPYDELVASLAQWRMQRGLAPSTGGPVPRASARSAPPAPVPAAPVLPSTRQSGAVAAMAAPAAVAAMAMEQDVAEINSFAPEFDAGDFVEHEGTELRDRTGSVADGDIEVDDALDVLDEQDV